jgi:ATP sulfurylase
MKDSDFLADLPLRHQWTIISVGNLYSGLLEENFCTSEEEFEKFDSSLGIPLVIDANDEVLKFDKQHIVKIERKQYISQIYGDVPETYVGVDRSYPGSAFLSGFKVRDHYKKYVQQVVDNNRYVRRTVEELKSKFGSVGGFQTRNIPHFGHEAIIHEMLRRCDYLVVNPVIGPKKRGDATLYSLEQVFNKFLTEKFSGRVLFTPLIANMYYAGPVEAIHHARMRERLGFDLFSVGRDHAGAEGVYEAYLAVQTMKSIQHRFRIALMLHDGAGYCTKCTKGVLLNSCGHSSKDICDISGTEFRYHLSSGIEFPFADRKLQESLFLIKEVLFEK